MTRVFAILPWLLLAGGAIVLALGPMFDLSDPDLFVGVVPAGVLIALAGLLFTKEREAKESTEKRSQFYLDSCIGAYARAKSLLEDGNNDRGTWIAAGRALKHARQLATDVTVDAHLRVLELERLMYRGFFHKFLQSKDRCLLLRRPRRSYFR